MNPFRKFVKKVSESARSHRAKIFRSFFEIDGDTKILDLGSENGSNIRGILEGVTYDPQNIFIADIDPESLEEGQRLLGFSPVLIKESEGLPFPDHFFDIVYCSSVIEHVTVPKSELWDYTDTETFKRESSMRQEAFAKEIMRVGKQYFVQTPCKSFPIESHSWLPLVGYLPRKILLPVIRFSNRYWMKVTEPDFNLLGARDLMKLFSDAELFRERKYWLTKSIMAIKRHSRKETAQIKSSD